MPFAKEKFFGPKGSINKGIVKERLKKLKDLPSFLSKRNAKIYTLPNCVWCIKQKQLINKYLPELNDIFINVDSSTELPKEIKGFPTLVYDDSNTKNKLIIEPGFKSLDRLQTLLNNLRNNSV